MYIYERKLVKILMVIKPEILRERTREGREQIRRYYRDCGRILDTNTRGCPGPDVRDALDQIWRGVVPALMFGIALQR